MRKTIARRLTESKQQIPHIYLTVDIRLDALLTLRGELNASLASRNIKLSVNDMLIKALALALIEVPECNVSFAGDTLIKYSRADISVAGSIDGGLITPIVADAASKAISAISSPMLDLAAAPRRASSSRRISGRHRKHSNMGMFGIKQFDAVINPPQAMIMAIGAGEKRPMSSTTPPGRNHHERHRQLRPPRHRRRRWSKDDASVQATGGEPAGAGGLSQTFREISISRRVRLITGGLLCLQIGGCVLDLTTEQMVLESGFCLVTRNMSLQTVANAVWATLSLSWIVGLVSLRFAQLRVVYWILIVLAPVAYVAQMNLLNKHVFSCDAPWIMPNRYPLIRVTAMPADTNHMAACSAGG
jgi:hypothetical protein